MDDDRVSLTITRVYHAPRERVYDAFTQPALFAQWWGSPGTANTDVELDANVGGRFSVQMHLPPDARWGGGGQGGATATVTRVSGEFTEVVPRRMLSYTFQWEGSERITQVAAEFDELADGDAQLTLLHEGLPNRGFAEYERIWNDSLDRLEALLD